MPRKILLSGEMREKLDSGEKIKSENLRTKSSVVPPVGLAA